MSENETIAVNGTQKSPNAFFTKIYPLLQKLPAILFAIFSILLFLIYIFPVAVMPGGNFMGERIPSESYGNVYTLVEDLPQIKGALIALIIFAVVCLLFSIVALAGIFYLPLKAKTFNVAKKRISLNLIFNGICAILVFITFIIGCVICGKISSADGGLGVMKAGACPILLIIFSILFLIAIVGSPILENILNKKYPELKPKPTIIDENQEMKPSKFIQGVKKHKKKIIITAICAVILAVIIVAVVVIINLLNSPFRIKTIQKVDIGDSYSQVEKILGEPYSKNDAVWTYHDEDYIEILDKLEKNGEKQENALNSGDLETLGKLTEEEATLREKLQSDGFKIITVNFADQKVSSVNLKITGNLEKQIKNSKILKGETHNLSNDTQHEIVFEAQFTDGSYVKTTATATSESTGSSYSVGAVMNVTWEYGGFEFKGTIPVVKSQIYTIKNGTLYVNDASLVLSSAFSGANKDAITKIVVENGITEIGQQAFQYFTKVKEVVLPDGLKEIKADAFFACWELETINIPTSVEKIGLRAFGECNKLIKTENGVNYVNNWVVGCEDTATEIVIKDGTMGIVESAFNNSVIEKVTIAESVKYINRVSFLSCTNLSQVVFISTEGWQYTNAEGATETVEKSIIEDAERMAKHLKGGAWDYSTMAEYWSKV